MYRSLSVRLIILTALFSLPVRAEGEETRIDVRVISKGAKFIGTSMGGVEITIADADTNQLLAQGKTTGSTGDTAKIMNEPLPHHAPVSTEDAAVFHATLDLDEPRRIKVTGRGPLAQPQAIATVSATQWVLPGKSITAGDAWTLEMPGFVVDILDPPAHQQLTGSSPTIKLKANVTMMCGCPIAPDGLWDANHYEVVAIVKRDGKKISEIPLRYAGSISQFHTQLELREPGAYEITVYAYDPANGNTGLDKTTVVLAGS